MGVSFLDSHSWVQDLGEWGEGWFPICLKPSDVEEGPLV